MTSVVRLEAAYPNNDPMNFDRVDQELDPNPCSS